MLRFLLLSEKGEGYELGQKLVQEGCGVIFWASHADKDLLYDPFGIAVDRYEEYIEEYPSTIVVDIASRNGGLCETLRKRGYAVLGGRLQGLLTDEEYARPVSRMLPFLHAAPLGDDFTMLCGWFNMKWLKTYTMKLYPRLLEGDRGPTTKGMGVVAWSEMTVLLAISDLLARSKSCGFVGIVLDKDLNFIRFETSLDGPWIPAIVECEGQPLSQLLYNCAQGFIPPNTHIHYGCCVTVNALQEITIPSEASKHVWGSNYISAQGVTIREARRRCYRTVNNIFPIDTIYRRDIGE